MYRAWEALPSATQKRLEGLQGVNAAEKPEAAATRVHRIDDRPGGGDAATLRALHPIVRIHPETGRRALYCSNAHTIGIQGLGDDESRELLETLYRIQQRPEHCCRFRWSQGAVAFWDNRCTQHNALNDYQGYRRVMYRVTIEGDRPR